MGVVFVRIRIGYSELQCSRSISTHYSLSQVQIIFDRRGFCAGARSAKFRRFYGDRDEVHNMSKSLRTFAGDYYGTRCVTGEKSGDIYNDFLDSLDRLDIDVSPPT